MEIFKFSFRFIILAFIIGAFVLVVELGRKLRDE
jgi:hypothetical protein